MKKRIIIGITGASGAPLAVELLMCLRQRHDAEVHLICTECGELTLEYEAGMKLSQLREFADAFYDNHDYGAPPASGSFKTDGMVVVPCSMKSLAGIACGYCDTLLLRAADVTLKEKRRLILVPRETPMSTIHLKNMTELSKMGAYILPPVPAYYNRPVTIEEHNHWVAEKIMDILGFSGALEKSWSGL